ncbi:hypothetical protein BDZ89DRAFT_1136002 [Hymenopellis radicata]|nr:hypothetical protein BDZ89DRAFT_1136002 [Hymenopellis radicata]
MYSRVQQPAAPLRETHVSPSFLTRRPKSTCDRPAKPFNAFILFRTAYNKAGRELAKTIAELTSVSAHTALQQANVSRDAAAAWRALGSDEWKEWEEKVDILRYKREHKWGDTDRPRKYNLRVEGEGVLRTSEVV